jgi:hypothetical protein
MVELLLLRARALRSIGLVEKAIAALVEKSSILPSPELKGAVTLELAECHAAKGDLAQAVKVLGEAFALVGPGDLAQQIGGRLAEFCLRADQPEQAYRYAQLGFRFRRTGTTPAEATGRGIPASERVWSSRRRPAEPVQRWGSAEIGAGRRHDRDTEAGMRI